MADTGESPKPRRWRRRLGCAFWVGLIGTAAALVLVQAEPFQCWVVRTVAARALGAEVMVRGIDFPSMGTLRVEALSLSESGMVPVVSLQGLSLDYQVMGDGGRHITKLTIENAAVNVMEVRSGRTNYAFLQRDASTPPSDADPMRFTPREIRIKTLEVATQHADWSMGSQGLGLRGTIEASDQMSFALEGDAVEAQWRTAWLPDPVQSNGMVQAFMARTPQGIDLNASLHLPEVGELVADGHLGIKPAGMSAEMSATAELKESFLAALASDRAGMPVRFETIHVPTLEVTGAYGLNGFSLENATVEAAVDGLVVGDADAPFYAGNLAMEGQRADDDPSAMDLIFTLAEGQTSHVRASLADGQPVFQARVDDWSREALAASIPAPWRAAVLAWLGGLKKVDAEATAGPTTIQGRITPAWNYADETAPTLHGEWSRRSGEGHLSAGGLDLFLMRPAGSALRMHLNLNKLPFATWYRGWTGAPLPGGIEGTLTGDMVATQQKDRGYRLQSTLTGAFTVAGGLRFPEAVVLMLNGTASVTDDLQKWHGQSLSANIPDVAQVDLTEFHLITTPFNATTAVSATADLAALGPLLQQPALRGEAALKGKLSLADGILSGPITLTGETLGHGDYFTPYGEPVSLRGELLYNLENVSATLDGAVLQLGEGTRAATESLHYAPASLRAEALSIETDLAPAVSKGYLDAVDGTATLHAPGPTYTPEGMTGEATLRADLARVVLPGGLAALEGLITDNALDLAGGVHGQGTVTAKSLLAAGLTFHDIRANTSLAEGVLGLLDVESTVAGGALRGSMAVALMDPAHPITVGATIEGADLAAFSEELKLDDVRLTGIADGRLHLVYGADGLRELDASLVSEENFTVNRDLIERALLAQFVKDAIGGGLTKQALRIIGDAPQRPFDSATATLGYDAATRRVLGTVTLKSRLLDLPIEVRADLDAVLQVLRLKQEGLMDGLGDSPETGVK